ncbi:hypothetical protein WMY93_012982 [Mugilogobius chulae]|uniref:Uncharacterized protein n=1 Tax=Mugilogobius chulae TaxID=88201 RepID=A0AAW0NYN5_9GOBI
MAETIEKIETTEKVETTEKSVDYEDMFAHRFTSEDHEYQEYLKRRLTRLPLWRTGGAEEAEEATTEAETTDTRTGEEGTEVAVGEEAEITAVSAVGEERTEGSSTGTIGTGTETETGPTAEIETETERGPGTETEGTAEGISPTPNPPVTATTRGHSTTATNISVSSTIGGLPYANTGNYLNSKPTHTLVSLHPRFEFALTQHSNASLRFLSRQVPPPREPLLLLLLLLLLLIVTADCTAGAQINYVHPVSAKVQK